MDAGDLATWVGSSFAAIAAGATIWTLKSQRDQIDEQRQFIAEQSATLALGVLSPEVGDSGGW